MGGLEWLWNIGFDGSFLVVFRFWWEIFVRNGRCFIFWVSWFFFCVYLDMFSVVFV